MNETTKLHLKKPGPEDFYDVGDFNGNADIIDGAISKLQKGKAEANHTHSAATQSAAGMMSAADKKKLDIGDARTVGGHTVESDVPANAAFTDTTDSDVVSGAAGFVSLDGLQGGVPFSGLLLDGDIAGQEVILRACGKNLLSRPYSSAPGERGGIDFAVNGDGSITMNGTAASTAFFKFTDIGGAFPAGTYTISGYANPNVYAYVNVYSVVDGTKKAMYSAAENGTTFTIDGSAPFSVMLVVNSGTVCDNIRIFPQLERGSSATAFEPYSGSELKITPDQAPYSVPGSIAQQEGENCVFVSAGTVRVTGVRSNRALHKIWTDGVPANGGNSDTVGGHTVDSDVPANAFAEATESTPGMMSAADKKKLDDIDEGANNYTLPKAGTSNIGGVMIGDHISVKNGVIGISRDDVNGAVGNPSATEIGVHKCCVGTAAPDDDNCPVGAWYGQY